VEGNALGEEIGMGKPRLRAVVSYIRRISEPQGSVDNDRELLQVFASHGDEAAFATLVERHAPMVFGICRRVLAHHHSAEDATQATFLVLARKAGEIRWRDAIAPWLSAVAYRISLKARETNFSRAESLRNEQLCSAPPADQAAGLSELRAIVDEEIQRLPERLRNPVVLCYLEGKTYEQAARALGWSASTIKGRLEKARGVLRSRLGRRELLSGIGGPPVVFESLFDPPLLPGKMAPAIARTAVLIRSGEVASPGILSPTVAALMACPIPGLTFTKIGLGIALLLLVSASVVGGVFLAEPEPEKEIALPASTTQQTRVNEPGQPALAKPAANSHDRLDHFGDPLPPDAIGRFGTTRLRHGGGIGYVRFNPDGKTLVSVGMDGVRVWNAGTGAALFYLPKSQESVTGSPVDRSAFERWLAVTGSPVDVSPDGKWLAVPAKSSIGIYALDNGHLLKTIGTDKCARVCFSPDGEIIASVTGRDGTEIKLWEAASGRLLRSWKEREGPITTLLFAGNRKTLITGNTAWRPPEGRDQNHISSWDTSTGKEKGRIELLQFAPSEIAASADGRLLAALCSTNTQSHVQVWDLETGNEIWRLEPGPEPKDQPGRPRELKSLAFFPDGKLLIAGRGDDELVVWSLNRGMERRRFDRDLALSSTLAVSSDGKNVAAVPVGQAIRIIEWANGKDQFPEMAYSYHEVVGFAANDRMVVLRDKDHVTTWDPVTGRERKIVERAGLPFWRIRLTPNGQNLQGWDEHPRGPGVRAVSTWDLSTGRELQRIVCPQIKEEMSYPLDLSPDGKTVALLDMSQRPIVNVVLMDVASGKVLRTLTGNTPSALRASFTPDGLKLIVWSTGKQSSLHVWDLFLNQRLWQIRFEGPDLMDGMEPVMSLDGRKMVVAGLNRSLLIFDLGTGELAQRIEKLADAPHLAELSKDGRSLAWVGKNSPTVSIVELATGKERLRLAGHEGRITSLHFSADSKLLASYSDDMTGLAWDLTGRLNVGLTAGKPLSATELERSWESLANEDSARAYQAIQQLSLAPTETVDFLSGRLISARSSNNKPSAAERLRQTRAVETLELIGLKEAHSLLQALAKGKSGAWLTQEAKQALGRLNVRLKSGSSE
jgi:RNA polymerase sigma factor (sigma-70 family)